MTQLPVTDSRPLDLDRLAADVLLAVEERQGKRITGGEIRFQCLHPERHNNGDAKPSARYNPDKRTWCCDVCGGGKDSGIYGGPDALAPLLGIDLDRYRTPDPVRRNGHHRQPPAALDEPPDLGPAKSVDWSKFVATYDWRDADGVLRFRVAKTKTKGFPVFQPAADGKRWHPTSKGLTPFLYHVADLVTLDTGSEVFVCEGEKDADRLRAEGFDATTFPGWCRNRWAEAGGPLAGHHVVVVADHDDTGTSKATEAVKVAHSAGAASVRVLDFAEALGADGQPGMLPDGFDVSQYLDQDGTAAELRRMADAAPRIPPPPPPQPSIETWDRGLADITRDALAVLHEANEAGPAPVVCIRGVGLAHVQRDDDGRPVIRDHDTESLRSLLADGAVWTRTTIGRKGPNVRAVAPPRDVVSNVQGQRGWDFPPLRGVATAPILTPSGRILSAPGYDRDTGIVYHGPTFDVLDTPPSTKEVDAARDFLLTELLGDFPFTDDASRAHAVAYGLLPFVRPAIDGAAPMFLSDAPKAGTGKGLLVDVLAVPFTGPLGPAIIAAPRQEEELAKATFALLLAGTSHAVIDNVPSRLNSASLAALLTAPVFTQRVLGVSEVMTVRNRTAWAMTANNARLTEELARRTYWSRLDAVTERPWERDPSEFRHSDLRTWARDRRGVLVDVLTTFIRAWLAEDRPAWRGRPLGGFEDWSRTIGGILDVAGIDGFLSNAAELWENADPEAQAWRGFVSTWAGTHGTEPVTASELVPLAIQHEAIGEDKKSPALSLGRALGHRVDQVIAGWRVSRGEKTMHGVTWYLQELPW